MSCGCSNIPNCDGQNPQAPGDDSIESMASQTANLITTLLGTFTKTTINGRSTWSSVCSPYSTGIPGYPMNEGEGLICYMLRILPLITAIQGPQGPAGPAGSGSAVNFAVRSVGISTSITDTDAVLNCVSMASPITVTLPSIASLLAGKWVTIKTDGSQYVTITPSGGNTIDGNASMTLTVQKESVTLVSDNNNNWITV